MRLSEFIEETIFEIALGIHSAKVAAKDIVAVSPGSIDNKYLKEKSFIDFDISIVVKDAEAKTQNGKGGLSGSISVASVAKVGLSADAGAGTESKSESEQTHRISFKVPVYFNANHRRDVSIDHDAAIVEKLRNQSIRD